MLGRQGVVCHDADGKPCGRLTERECSALESAGKGRVPRSRKGAVVRFMLDAKPDNRICIGWLGGSHTTRRVPCRNDQGQATTAPIIEHKRLVSSTSQR